MKKKYMFKGLLVAVVVMLTFFNCTTDDKLIDELLVEREFSPVDLTAVIRTQTTVELNWMVDDNVQNYVVEISEDENFTTLIETLNVTTSQLPVQVLLAAETMYYIRVKAVSSRGLQDSKWSNISVLTLTEQIFLPIQPGDVLYNQATLRWVPNSVVSQIVVSPGNITYDITPEDRVNGTATITGLSGETSYTATLLNGSNIRGVRTFTTEIDPSTGTVINPLDNDLFQRIIDASPGDTLLLQPGDYTSQTGTITLDKSLTIRGLYSFDKPLLNVTVSIITGASEVSLIDLDLAGDVPTIHSDVVRYSDVGNYDSLLIRGCNIHDFTRSFIAGNVTSAIVTAVTVEDCIVTNVLTTGGDFIDFRNSDVLNLAVRTSTFDNCAPGRDFFRLDAAGDSNGTTTINVLLENCTLYGISDTSDRILYVRFNNNAITVRENLFAETTAYYSNQSSTDPNTNFINNNYFNAPGFLDSGQTLFDQSGTDTTLDPRFANPEAGDFSVSNQTIIDNNIGDPRWFQ